jgi:NAD(P)-dependent dehydrogenase (short-subunit alcohol dehydrogenase family)
MIITSSVAGTSLAGSSMAYSVTKAAQLHLMRSLALTQGEKVRVNAVLPGLLLTEWVSLLPFYFLGEIYLDFLRISRVLWWEYWLNDCTRCAYRD